MRLDQAVGPLIMRRQTQPNDASTSEGKYRGYIPSLILTART